MGSSLVFSALSRDIGANLVGAFDAPCLPMGGLGGLPFAGRTAWELFRHHAQKDDKKNLLLVYGSSTDISAGGEVGTGPSAMGAAFDTIVEHNGIAGLPEAYLRDKNDTQQARLLLEVARVYEDELIAHPESRARLAYSHFNALQSSLREVVDWSELTEGVRLASLGGISVRVAGDPEPHFLPLAFELLDPGAGCLDDLLDDLPTYGKVGGGRRGRAARWMDSWKKGNKEKPPRLHHLLLFPLDDEDGDGDGDGPQD